MVHKHHHRGGGALGDEPDFCGDATAHVPAVVNGNWPLVDVENRLLTANELDRGEMPRCIVSGDSS